MQEFGREIAGRIVLFALAIGKLGKQLSLFERLLMDGFAFGPQGAELTHILCDGAVDALLIESKQLEIFAFGEPGAGSGERFVDGKLGGVVAGVGDEGSECALMAESEDAGFEGASAV